MTPMANDEFAEAVMNLGGPDKPFKPGVIYIPEGDCLECIFSNDDYYAERIDGLVTVYYSRESGQIVGSLIKGIRSFCKRMLETNPGFGIVIEDGTVKLEHVFLAHVLNLPKDCDKLVALTYRKLIAKAEEADLDVDLDCVGGSSK